MAMPPPSARMATHFIRVTPVDDLTRVEEYSMAPAYDTAGPVAGTRAYIGIVRQRGQSEDVEGRIYSDGSATVVVFSAASPHLLARHRVEWGLMPAGYVPPVGASGPISPPPGWSPECVGVITADGSPWTPGAWRADVLAVT